MILKLLGITDLLVLVSLLLVSYLPETLVIIMAVYLIIKGVIFTLFGDPISLADIFCGLYIVSAAYGLAHWSITLIIIVFILQKSVVSILS
ncbi:hypothetical protein J4440_04445 [Candidatus Woesearchaeota archaeon]|nr:hypothetical protein [Candidatus Woesearchaeota archaeon]